MKSFDMVTATLLVSVLYIVMPTITWFVLGESRTRAAAFWCIGGIAMGVATFMISTFSGSPHPTLALSAPLFLYLFSYAVRAQSLRMELGRPYSMRATLLALLIGTVAFEILHRVVGLYVPRALFVSFAFAVGAGLISLNAIQIARVEQSKMARWIALAYCTVAVAFLFRMAYLSQQDFSRVQGNVVTDGAASVVAAVVLLLSSVIGHFGYVGLFLERAQRQSVLSSAEQARVEVRQQLGAQIVLLERRQSLGELAASIGHELNQPLTAILTNTQLAKRGLQTGRMDSEAVQQLLSKVEQNTQRASKILERIRNFMRSKESLLGIVDMHAICDDVLELMEGDFRKRNVRIEIGPKQGTELVNGDALQLSQVLLNLVRNALDSMETADEPRIRIECLKKGKTVRVCVRDWGLGLREDQCAQVGKPFFSTKPKGLGMGISISRSIARNHGGNLTLDNADDGLGAGALAVLELPSVAQGVSS